MRIVLVALGLIALGACTTPAQQTVMLNDNLGLIRFVEPVDGAAWSESDVRYYTQNANGFADKGACCFMGGAGTFKHP